MAKTPWSKVTEEQKKHLVEQFESVGEDKPVSSEHVAAYLDMSTATLAKWRLEQPNLLPWVTIGKRKVGYIKRVVVAFGMGESMAQFQNSA